MRSGNNFKKKHIIELVDISVLNLCGYFVNGVFGACDVVCGGTRVG